MGASKCDDDPDLGQKGRASWRAPAPAARRVASLAYSWRSPEHSVVAGVVAAAPFAALAFTAPALLSLSSPLDMISPIADARAATSGVASWADLEAPVYTALLSIGDRLADTAGRSHLIAKAIAACVIAAIAAFFASSRVSFVAGAVMSAALAAWVAAPLSGATEIAGALFLCIALALLTASADRSSMRACLEGGVCSAGVVALWFLHPLFALVALAALSSCPFICRRLGLVRYFVTLAGMAVLCAAAEFLAPGVNGARAAMASASLQKALGEGLFGVAAQIDGAVLMAALALALTFVFGGAGYIRAWAPSIGLALLGGAAFVSAGLDATPVFAMAAAAACFSIASPFYEALYRGGDRACVSVAAASAFLALVGFGAVIASSAHQFSLQARSVAAAPAEIRAAFGLATPGGPMIARWLEEGRFSAAEARTLFSLASVDQSAILLEGAARARELEAQTEVAILTGSDAACVIATARRCAADGPAAVGRSGVVLVPRLAFNPPSEAAKQRAEVILYTEFKLVEQSAFWDIWVRRGADFSYGSTATSLF